MGKSIISVVVCLFLTRCLLVSTRNVGKSVKSPVVSTFLRRCFMLIFDKIVDELKPCFTPLLNYSGRLLFMGQPAQLHNTHITGFEFRSRWLDRRSLCVCNYCKGSSAVSLRKQWKAIECTND